MSDRKYTMAYDGLYDGEETFFEDVDEYLDHCEEMGNEPAAELEACEARALRADAAEVLERIYEREEVDPNGCELHTKTKEDVAELQALIDAWCDKHLNGWCFPCGEWVDISSEVAEWRARRAAVAS